jgi:hypothetical protein
MGVNNILLCSPNRADATAVLSNGSWRAALPLANVTDAQFTKVARSTDATLASTKFDIDMTTARALRLIALSNHNLSQSATWRVTLGTTAGGADVYDSGWGQVWRMTFDNEMLRWESPSWWLGTASNEFVGHPFPAVLALSDWYTARYGRVEINDTTNTAGYVQIGRAHFCNGFEPAVNAAYGLKDGWSDLSTSSRAESGALWFNARRRIRTVQMMLDSLSQSEGDTLYELMRSAGTVGEVFYVPQPSDPGACQRYGFAGRLAELSPLDFPRPIRRALPVRLEEII